MHALQKKAKRLEPVIEDRKLKFDAEMAELNAVRKRKLETVSAMRTTQKEYMNGVARLNQERGTSDRLMLEALEIGLDSVKNLWMKLYQDVLDIERQEKDQLEVMSRAHRDLEAIKTLQDKYNVEWVKEMARREQKGLDEHALRKFYR